MGCQISWLSWPFTWVTKFSPPKFRAWLVSHEIFTPEVFPLCTVVNNSTNIRKLHPATATYVGILTWDSGVLDLASRGKLLVAFVVPWRVFALGCACAECMVIFWIPTLYTHTLISLFLLLVESSFADVSARCHCIMTKPAWQKAGSRMPSSLGHTSVWSNIAW